jgi:PKD repeat protein
VVLTAEAGFSNYIWSDNTNGQSLTVDAAGNYTVSAEDVNGCQVQSSVQAVTMDAPFTIDVNPSGTIGICVGENVVLTAETGYSNYVWSNSTNGTTLNVTSGGAYSVSAQNANGCSGTSDAVFVNETLAPNSTFTYMQVEDVYQVDFTSSFDADTYLWNFGNNQTSTEANPSFTFPFDNTYPVTLITTNACGSDTVTIDVVVIKTGIENLNSVSSFNISPNPGSDYFRIKGNSLKPQSLIVQVYTMTGQVIQHKSILVKGAFSVEFESNELPAGVYMIRVSDSTSEITQKWIKQ